MTTYPENVIFSVNMLLTKNKEYLAEMRELSGEIAAKDIDAEVYLIETEYGNKIVPVSIVSPEIAQLTLNDVRSIYARVLENNAAIRALLDSLDDYDMTSAEVVDLFEANGLVAPVAVDPDPEPEPDTKNFLTLLGEYVSVAGEPLTITTPLPPKYVILGTDYGGDCDDVGAVNVLSDGEEQGEYTVLGITVPSNSESWTSAMIEGQMLHHGHADIPIGIEQDSTDTTSPTFWPWDIAPHFLTDAVNKRNDTREHSTALYRREIYNSPEKVTIIEVGFLTAFAKFLQSPADYNSDGIMLTGAEIVAQKVDKVITMGGGYPSRNTSYNYAVGDPANAAKYVFENCPVDIIGCGYEVGDTVVTGSSMFSHFSDVTDDPTYYAYSNFAYTDASGNRQSWDPITVLYYRRPDLFDLSAAGEITIDDTTGGTSFAAGVNPSSGAHHYYITKVETDANFTALINDIFIRQYQG